MPWPAEDLCLGSSEAKEPRALNRMTLAPTPPYEVTWSGYRPPQHTQVGRMTPGVVTRYEHSGGWGAESLQGDFSRQPHQSEVTPAEATPRGGRGGVRNSTRKVPVSLQEGFMPIQTSHWTLEPTLFRLIERSSAADV